MFVDTVVFSTCIRQQQRIKTTTVYFNKITQIYVICLIECKIEIILEIAYNLIRRHTYNAVLFTCCGGVNTSSNST